MDWIKSLFSIEERKASILGFLLIISTGFTLYYCRNMPDILLELNKFFLIAFVSGGGINLLSNIIDYKNKINNVLNVIKNDSNNGTVNSNNQV